MPDGARAHNIPENASGGTQRAGPVSQSRAKVYSVCISSPRSGRRHVAQRGSASAG